MSHIHAHSGRTWPIGAGRETHLRTTMRNGKNSWCSLYSPARLFISKSLGVDMYVSIENPMSSMSWKLDIVEDMIRLGSLRAVDSDCCSWGLKDLGNGLAYKKGVRLACSFDIAELGRKCPKNHEHQVIRGPVDQGPRRGEYRSKISGEYPHAVCQAWATLAVQATR